MKSEFDEGCSLRHGYCVKTDGPKEKKKKTFFSSVNGKVQFKNVELSFGYSFVLLISIIL